MSPTACSNPAKPSTRLCMGLDSDNSIYRSSQPIALVRRDSAADVGHLDLVAQPAGLGGAQFRVTVVAPCPDAGDEGIQFGIRGAAPQQGTQVVAFLGEQAGKQLAFSGQAQAGAGG